METNSANRELLTPTPTTHGLHRTVLALAALAMAGAMAGFATGAQANLLGTGSFEGGVGGFSGGSGSCPSTNTQQMTNSDMSGWTTGSGYTFILNAGNYGSFANSYGGGSCIGLQSPITASPDGGNFLASDPSYLNGSTYTIATTLLTGLVMNATYHVTFYAAAGEQTTYTTANGMTNDWLVGLGTTAGTGNSAAAPGISLPAGPGGFSGWVAQQINLVATATSEVLWFFGQSNVGISQPPFLFLDGVSMTQQTTVPEPSTYGVLLVGLLALLGVRRVYRNKKA